MRHFLNVAGVLVRRLVMRVPDRYELSVGWKDLLNEMYVNAD